MWLTPQAVMYTPQENALCQGWQLCHCQHIQWLRTRGLRQRSGNEYLQFYFPWRLKCKTWQSWDMAQTSTVLSVHRILQKFLHRSGSTVCTMPSQYHFAMQNISRQLPIEHMEPQGTQEPISIPLKFQRWLREHTATLNSCRAYAEVPSSK